LPQARNRVETLVQLRPAIIGRDHNRDFSGQSLAPVSTGILSLQFTRFHMSATSLFPLPLNHFHADAPAIVPSDRYSQTECPSQPDPAPDRLHFGFVFSNFKKTPRPHKKLCLLRHLLRKNSRPTASADHPEPATSHQQPATSPRNLAY
jgi:hypothetical protein